MSLQPERIASATLHIGDCLDVLPQLAAEGFRAHAVITDPPYHLTSGNLAPDWSAFKTQPGNPKKGSTGSGDTNRSGRKGGFMGQQWDGGDVAFRPETWRAVFECMLPGAHLVACGGTRTSHRMVCAIEDAGFEIRDTLMWVYGSGFPKSLDVSRAIDRAAGAEREVVGAKVYGDDDRTRNNFTPRNKSGRYNLTMRVGIDPNPVITAPATPEAAAWAGWGTALKPSYEPIILARKPLSEGNVAANVLRHGCGAINVDASRVPASAEDVAAAAVPERDNLRFCVGDGRGRGPGVHDMSAGRWPANLLHDGSPEVEQAFAAFGERSSGTERGERGTGGIWSGSSGKPCGPQYGDTGSASRFFFTAKADARDRAGSRHPTVKPASLMRWLVRLVTPPGGTILDPFAGTGSTGLAADQCGMRSVLIERDPTYAGDALRKIREDAPLFAEAGPVPDLDAAYQRHGDLFADAAD